MYIVLRVMRHTYTEALFNSRIVPGFPDCAIMLQYVVCASSS